jgi:hypothetical protein
VRTHESAHPRDHVPVLGTLREMALEEPEQEPPVHRQGSLAEARRRRRGWLALADLVPDALGEARELVGEQQHEIVERDHSGEHALGIHDRDTPHSEVAHDRDDLRDVAPPLRKIGLLPT